MLSKREEIVLKFMVTQFITSAVPVSSESIAASCALGLGPASIRTQMAHLEEQGYITRPHISAGGIPSDKGYRYYVESLAEEGWLSAEEQQSIEDLFSNVRQGLEEWGKLATAVLAGKLKTVALVLLPQSHECRLRHLDLVAIQEFLVLLVLVMQEVKLRQQLIHTEHAVSQDDLNIIANKLNTSYKGLTYSEIDAQKLELSPFESGVKTEIKEMMKMEDERQSGELYLDGLRHLLAQPEFATNSNSRTSELVEILEERRPVHNLFSSIVDDTRETKVVIGSENTEKALQNCSVVLRSYGIPGETIGTIGVIGPTRMPYARVIPTVDYLSSVMTESLKKLGS